MIAFTFQSQFIYETSETDTKHLKYIIHDKSNITINRALVLYKVYELLASPAYLTYS